MRPVASSRPLNHGRPPEAPGRSIFPDSFGRRPNAPLIMRVEPCAPNCAGRTARVELRGSNCAGLIARSTLGIDESCQKRACLARVAAMGGPYPGGSRRRRGRRRNKLRPQFAPVRIAPHGTVASSEPYASGSRGTAASRPLRRRFACAFGAHHSIRPPCQTDVGKCIVAWFVPAISLSGQRLVTAFARV